MKDSIKVVVANYSKGQCEAIKLVLEETSDIEIIGIVTNGQDAIDMITAKKPDVALIGMVLPVIDGIGVLDKISAIPQRPKVIMLAEYANETIVKIALSKGAEYLMIKPIDDNILSERIQMLANQENSTFYKNLAIKDEIKFNFEENVCNFIKMLGVPVHISGYPYLRDSIIWAVSDVTVLNPITKQLYHGIAEKHHTTLFNVQRCITYAIKLLWENGDHKEINKLLGCTLKSNMNKPTNANFIAMVADKIRLQMNG